MMMGRGILLVMRMPRIGRRGRRCRSGNRSMISGGFTGIEFGAIINGGSVMTIYVLDHRIGRRKLIVAVPKGWWKISGRHWSTI